MPDGCGVFVSRWHHGSPAHRYSLYALQFVQEVNGVPTPDLEAFVQAISKLVRTLHASQACQPSTEPVLRQVPAAEARACEHWVACRRMRHLCASSWCPVRPSRARSSA